MKVCLISDNHSYHDEMIERHFKWANEIWHAGDIGDAELLDKMSSFGKLRAVSGNIDGKDITSRIPELLVFELEGVKVMILHIGGYPPRYNKNSKTLLDEHKPDLFIAGHSHILKVMNDKERKLLYLNPGAAGIQGFHKKRTLLRFKIEKGTVKDLELVQLGDRGT